MIYENMEELYLRTTMTKILSDDNLLGDYIRAHREALGLSLAEVARRSGIDYKYWSKVEIGDLRLPSARHLTLMATTIAAPIEDLYGLVGYDFPERLPSLGPYLRTKYDLPPEALADLEHYFDLLRSYYDIPEGAPVFPPKQSGSSSRPQPHKPAVGRRNSDSHPWRST
jgi:transcriptional regulator with XRE-family HTH domain